MTEFYHVEIFRLVQNLPTYYPKSLTIKSRHYLNTILLQILQKILKNVDTNRTRLTYSNIIDSIRIWVPDMFYYMIHYSIIYAVSLFNAYKTYNTAFSTKKLKRSIKHILSTYIPEDRVYFISRSAIIAVSIVLSFLYQI